MSDTYEEQSPEAQEWVESLEEVMRNRGLKYTSDLIKNLEDIVRSRQVSYTNKSDFFVNTTKQCEKLEYPGNRKLERNIENLNRWNAILMVVKANEKDDSLGGHIASTLSIVNLYEVGFNHFFKASKGGLVGDLVFYQGHTAPAIYARSYLENRITEEHLCNFRQQINKSKCLSSYPHPFLQPEYWQFPTVSMGLGPMQAIYQARFMKYLESHKLIIKGDSKVWSFCGDGEMNEPEAIGAITHASREKLDNLIFIVNCNLQCLDGCLTFPLRREL